MDLSLLRKLTACHSTPGDETAVRDLLLDTWQADAWVTTQHGHYGISARPGAPDPSLPTILITAHMDSPGWIVERVEGQTLTLIRLGGTALPQSAGHGLLKTSRGHYPVTIEKHTGDDDTPATYTASFSGKAAVGDRVCHRPRFECVDDRYVLSPFLDNRIGCFMLAALSGLLGSGSDLPANIVLAATGTEEMGGYGAAVLARELAPDLAICLDATYEFPEQGVHMGDGPVLTLSDAAILMSMAARDRVAAWFAARDLPLQMESYNYAGTDARAFPHQGLRCPVMALLLATTGNHSPVERCAVADLENLLASLHAMVTCDPADWPLPLPHTP